MGAIRAVTSNNVRRRGTICSGVLRCGQYITDRHHLDHANLLVHAVGGLVAGRVGTVLWRPHAGPVGGAIAGSFSLRRREGDAGRGIGRSPSLALGRSKRLFCFDRPLSIGHR
jgi:hypothetical protein